MVLMQCSFDRWEAHTEIAARFSKPGSDRRNYLWRFSGEGEAIVRDQSEPIDVPDVGTAIRFGCDCVPVRKTHGRRRRISDSYMEQWFIDKLGTSIQVDAVAFRPIPFKITRNGETFSRPAIRVRGQGLVLNTEELRHLLVNGIGDAKAYGFGLLEIEGIK